jgi:hypothetical protein
VLDVYGGDRRAGDDVTEPPARVHENAPPLSWPSAEPFVSSGPLDIPVTYATWSALLTVIISEERELSVAVTMRVDVVPFQK